MNKMIPNSRPDTDLVQNDISPEVMLRTIIHKASDNGLRIQWIALDEFRVWTEYQYLLEDGGAGIDIGVKEYSLSSPKEFLFNHDLAKALWGDKFINPDVRDDTGSRVIAIRQTAWKHHLRQMVIAADPIQYAWEHSR